MLQHNEAMDIRSKPTFVPRGHHLLFAFLLVCLLACLLASLFLCLPCISCLPALFLFHTLFAHFPSIACLLVSCFCLCMYTHGAREWSPRRKQRGRGRKHVNLSQAVVASRIRGLASPIWLYTLLNPSPSSSLFLLDGFYQVYQAVYHSSSSLEYGDSCLFSFTYILGHALGM